MHQLFPPQRSHTVKRRLCLWFAKRVGDRFEVGAGNHGGARTKTPDDEVEFDWLHDDAKEAQRELFNMTVEEYADRMNTVMMVDDEALEDSEDSDDDKGDESEEEDGDGSDDGNGSVASSNSDEDD